MVKSLHQKEIMCSRGGIWSHFQGMLIPTEPNGFACQNGTALIWQLNSAKQFHIFTDLTCIHALAKCSVLDWIYEYYIRKMMVNGAYYQKLHLFVSFDLTLHEKPNFVTKVLILALCWCAHWTQHSILHKICCLFKMNLLQDSQWTLIRNMRFFWPRW